MSKGPLARAGLALTIAFVTLLGTAPLALAADGVGIGGRTDDKKVTYWAFGVMVFFVLVVTIGSLIQMRLEGRKERLREDLERVHRPIG